MKCLVVVAHPDDETIWMGGTILGHRDWEWRIVSLSRADDPDRAPRFAGAAAALGARADISDLDDSPVLHPLSPDLREIKTRIARFVTPAWDLVFTHGPNGEYTRHERHEQVHRAVREMVESGALTGDLISFAYDDCGGSCLPRPAADAGISIVLPPDDCAAKRKIVRDIYGFPEGSLEYESAQSTEAFRVHTGGALPRLKHLLCPLQV